MPATRILILGCGYTGRRVAASLVEHGHDVIATTRNTDRLHVPGVTVVHADAADPESFERLRPLVSRDTLVLYSIPTIAAPGLDRSILSAVAAARRVVYISTTGVYGRQHDVDERSLPAPETPRELARVATEQAVSEAPGALILRPAAIYGPYRGIHVSMRSGAFQLQGDGANFVSRIHVEDLAAHCLAALFSDVGGAWPVADEDPCTSREIASFCASVLHIPMPSGVAPQQLSETRRADRRVDGAAIRRALRIQLRYPSYRVGIPASIEAEALDRAL